MTDLGIVCEAAPFLREGLMAERLARNGFEPISRDLEADCPALAAHLRALAARHVFADHLMKTIEQTLRATAG